MKGANEARRAGGVSRAAGRRSARTRRGEEERDAQVRKLRHLADVDRNGPAYLQTVQVSASVRRAEGGKRHVSTVWGVRSARRCRAGVHERRRGRRRCGEEARRGRALRTRKTVLDSQAVLIRVAISLVIAPHPRALHARRPLIAVLEEVGRRRAVRRLRARPHHRDGEERHEGVVRNPCHEPNLPAT